MSIRYVGLRSRLHAHVEPCAHRDTHANAAYNCGNGVLEPGETCDTCPNDCVVQPCNAASPEITYTVTFAPPSGEDANQVKALVGYNSSVLNLLAGSAASSRIRNRPRNGQVTADNPGVRSGGQREQWSEPPPCPPASCSL